MGEAKFGLGAPPGDVEDDVGVPPLVLLGDETELAIQDVPDDPLTRDGLADPLLGPMDVLVPIGELTAQLLGVAFELSCPPSADIVDGGEDLLRTLVHRK